jgi:hypothetical protein
MDSRFSPTKWENFRSLGATLKSGTLIAVSKGSFRLLRQSGLVRMYMQVKNAARLWAQAAPRHVDACRHIYGY